MFVIDVSQMTEKQRSQRRASAVHLAGLFILSYEHRALTVSGQERSSSVLKNALMSHVVLLSTGVFKDAGCITDIVNVNIRVSPRSLKSSDSVVLRQVCDVSKLFTLLLDWNNGCNF